MTIGVVKRGGGGEGRENREGKLWVYYVALLPAFLGCGEQTNPGVNRSDSVSRRLKPWWFRNSPIPISFQSKRRWSIIYERNSIVFRFKKRCKIAQKKTFFEIPPSWSVASDIFLYKIQIQCSFLYESLDPAKEMFIFLWFSIIRTFKVVAFSLKLSQETLRIDCWKFNRIFRKFVLYTNRHRKKTSISIETVENFCYSFSTAKTLRIMRFCDARYIPCRTNVCNLHKSQCS